MQEHLYVMPTKKLREERHRLAPHVDDAFHEFSKRVFSEGALPSKIKQLIAVAVAHVTQCPYCIQGHTRAAVSQGATPAEIMEAIWVAAEMRAGGSIAHSAIALDAIEVTKAPSSVGAASHVLCPFFPNISMPRRSIPLPTSSLE